MSTIEEIKPEEEFKASNPEEVQRSLMDQEIKPAPSLEEVQASIQNSPDNVIDIVRREMDEERKAA